MAFWNPNRRREVRRGAWIPPAMVATVLLVPLIAILLPRAGAAAPAAETCDQTQQAYGAPADPRAPAQAGTGGTGSGADAAVDEDTSADSDGSGSSGGDSPGRGGSGAGVEADDAPTDRVGPQPVDARGQPVEGVPELVYAFGSDRDPLAHRQALRLPDDMDAASLRVLAPVGDVSDENGRALAPSHFRVAYFTPPVGNLVIVSVCMNPMASGEIAPGTYTGAMMVGAGDRFTALNLRVTAQDDRWFVVYLYAIAGGLLGMLIKISVDQKSTDNMNTFRGACRHPRQLFTAGATAAACVYSYRTIYADDPTFHATLGSSWRVGAETLAAALASKAITDIAKPPDKEDAAIKDRSAAGPALDARPEERTGEEDPQAAGGHPEVSTAEVGNEARPAGATDAGPSEDQAPPGHAGKAPSPPDGEPPPRSSGLPGAVSAKALNPPSHPGSVPPAGDHGRT